MQLRTIYSSTILICVFVMHLPWIFPFSATFYLFYNFSYFIASDISVLICCYLWCVGPGSFSSKVYHDKEVWNWPISIIIYLFNDLSYFLKMIFKDQVKKKCWVQPLYQGTQVMILSLMGYVLVPFECFFIQCCSWVALHRDSLRCSSSCRRCRWSWLTCRELQ